MGKLITARDCSGAWLSSVHHLLEHGGDCFNLIVEIGKPSLEHTGIRKLLDAFLQESGKRPIDEVANTIFPQSLYFTTMGRQPLYENYELAWPLIRLFPINKSGTYFWRMIHWGRSEPHLNQLEGTIEKLKEAQTWNKAYKSRYEISVYQPEQDARNLMAFPCLSHLSFKLEDGKLHLTALYRNQYYIERAYGNLIGLGRLLNFVAKESNLVAGRLTCISSHAELHASKKVIIELLHSCMEARNSRRRQNKLNRDKWQLESC